MSIENFLFTWSCICYTDWILHYFLLHWHIMFITVLAYILIAVALFLETIFMLSGSWMYATELKHIAYKTTSPAKKSWFYPSYMTAELYLICCLLQCQCVKLFYSPRQLAGEGSVPPAVLAARPRSDCHCDVLPGLRFVSLGTCSAVRWVYSKLFCYISNKK